MSYPAPPPWNIIRIYDAGVESSGFFQVSPSMEHQQLLNSTGNEQLTVLNGLGFLANLNITMKLNATSSSPITADRRFLHAQADAGNFTVAAPTFLHNVSNGLSTTTSGQNETATAVCRQLDMFLFPLQLLIGVVGNLLNLAVLTRTSIRSSKQVYIVALAVTDLVFMIAQFLPHVTQYHLSRFGGSDGWLDNFSWHVSGVVVWIMQTSVLSSDLILTAFSVERCIAIAWPFASLRRGSDAGSAQKVVLGIVSGIAAHGCIELVMYYRHYMLTKNGDEEAANKSPAWLVAWDGEYRLVQLVLSPMVVFLTLVVTNFIILYALAKQRKYQRNVLNLPSATCTGVSRQFTAMLLATVLLYIVTNAFNFTLNAQQTWEQFTAWLTSEARNVKNSADQEQFTSWAIPCSQVMTNWNYSLNFLLYSAVSSQFRADFKHLWSSTKSNDSSCTRLVPFRNDHSRARQTFSTRTADTCLSSRTSNNGIPHLQPSGKELATIGLTQVIDVAKFSVDDPLVVVTDRIIDC